MEFCLVYNLNIGSIFHCNQCDETEFYNISVNSMARPWLHICHMGVNKKDWIRQGIVGIYKLPYDSNSTNHVDFHPWAFVLMYEGGNHQPNSYLNSLNGYQTCNCLWYLFLI